MASGHKLSATVLLRVDNRLKSLLEAEARLRQTSVSFLAREALLERYRAQLEGMTEVEALLRSQIPDEGAES